jgi:uncharacterized membrane protein
MDFSTIKQETKEVLVGNRLMFLLAVLVVSAICAIATPIFGIGIIVYPVLMGGLYLLGILILKEKKFDFYKVVELFKDLNHALKVIGVYFLTALIVSVGMFLFIIPGIIFTYRYSQALFIIIDNPEMGIMDALTESQKLMHGHKFELFLFQLSFIGHILLGIITFGLYFFYVIPYIQIAMYNYYLHLSGKNDVVKSNETILEIE